MYLLGATGASAISNFFQNLFSEIANLSIWPFIFLGLMLASVIIMAILIWRSYENEILRSINKLNNYFLSKPYITEENLVEFNLKMKSVPKVLRNNWQVYMLNREDSPTTYINTDTCIDKPLRTSSIEKNMSNFSIFTFLLAVVSFFVGLSFVQLEGFNGDPSSIGSILFYAGLVPFGIIVMYVVAILVAKAVKDDIYSSLYENFPLYERNLTKAVSTLPSYVDYEILFTKKEIKEGIPVLQQYLEKRALVEQQELERARANSVACEEYNFDELGIDGSLVLERAMRESETFIRTRNRLQEECGQIEVEKENYKKTFENNEKDFQRKLQASRENLESLKTQQEASTNRIESNYIRKQQSDEIKKQQQLEKDNEEATAKYNEEQISLQQEIDKRKQEIEEKKAFVEQAMLLEFKHYANTLYKALSEKVTEVGNQKLMSLAEENADLKNMIAELQSNGVENVNYVEPQTDIIQNEDLSSDNLYEISNSEMEKLKENREASNEYKLQEDIKQEEKQNENQNANLEVNNEKLYEENSDEIGKEDNLINNEENLNIDNNSNINNDLNALNDDLNNGVTNYVNDNSNEKFSDDNDNEDGGKVLNEEEDLETLQKKIEEENNKLQKQKQEFENDLNNTISKIDNNQTMNDFSNLEKYMTPNDFENTLNNAQASQNFQNQMNNYEPQNINLNANQNFQDPNYIYQKGYQDGLNQNYNNLNRNEAFYSSNNNLNNNSFNYSENLVSNNQNNLNSNFNTWQNLENLQPNENQKISSNEVNLDNKEDTNSNENLKADSLQNKTRSRRVSNASTSSRKTTRAKSKRVGRNKLRASSEIDALNAEMQKLLDSTKKNKE